MGRGVDVDGVGVDAFGGESGGFEREAFWAAESGAFWAAESGNFGAGRGGFLVDDRTFVGGDFDLRSDRVGEGMFVEGI